MSRRALKLPDPPRSGRPARRRAGPAPVVRLLLSALVLQALPGSLLGVPPAQAARNAFACSITAGRLTFLDRRLEQAYGSAPVIGLAVGGARWAFLAPVLELGCAWDARDVDAVAFVSGAETRMLLCPVLLHLPLEGRLSPSWRLRFGPALGWTWVREAWRASVPQAGIDAARQGTTGWIVGGLCGDIGLRIGRAGELALTAEVLWGAGDRATVGANELQVESLDAGWSRLGLRWRLPWPAAEDEAEEP